MPIEPCVEPSFFLSSTRFVPAYCSLKVRKRHNNKNKQKKGLVNFLTDKVPTPTHRGQVTTATAHLVMEMTLKNRVTSGSARREVEHEDLIRAKSS